MMQQKSKSQAFFPSPLFMSPADVLTKILMQSGVSTNLAIHDIQKMWPEIVGERIAQEVECLKIENSTLFLKAKNALWKSEILFQKDVLIQKVNQSLGQVIIRELKVY